MPAAERPDTSGDWDCVAYGPDLRGVGAICFVSGELHRRTCTTLTQCREAMQDERQRVFRRMQELAASGDPTWADIEAEFTHPEQLLGGGEQDPDRDPPAES